MKRAAPDGIGPESIRKIGKLDSTGLLSLAQYAASRRERGLPGGSVAAVYKALNENRIETVRGHKPAKIDGAAADASWLALTPVRSSSLTGAVPAPAAGDDDFPDAVEEDFNEAKTREARAAADIKELQRDERIGTLVDAGGVKRAWLSLVRSVKEQILGIPDRVCDELAALEDSADVRELLDKEIRRALSRLADNPPDARQ